MVSNSGQNHHTSLNSHEIGIYTHTPRLEFLLRNGRDCPFSCKITTERSGGGLGFAIPVLIHRLLNKHQSQV